MQQHNKQLLIEYRIQKAKDTIENVKLLLDNDRLRTALNRIYYAVFYIVSALAIKYNFSTSKHKQLIGWFNENFVKSGTVSIYYGKFIKIRTINVKKAITKILSFLINLKLKYTLVK